MTQIQPNKRRDFLKKVATIGAIAVVAPQIINARALIDKNVIMEDKGYSVLFQGDSITDGNRMRNNDWNHVMGHGYAYLVASRLWYDHPERGFHFFNRGISGNKVSDLAERWRKDALEIKPDLLSILIGINDVSRLIEGDNDYSVQQYEKGYRSLLQETKRELPNVKLVLCEPFILPVGKVKEKWKEFSEEIDKRQKVVQQLCEEHDAIFVRFQDAFNKALLKAPAEYWIWDGIHPMPAGHELMAREWIYQVGKKIKFIK